MSVIVFPECFSINFERHECDDGTGTVMSEIVARWSLMCPECITCNAALLQARSLFLQRHGRESHECVDSTGTVMSEIVVSTRWAETTRRNEGRRHAAAKRTYTASSTARGTSTMLREVRT